MIWIVQLGGFLARRHDVFPMVHNPGMKIFPLHPRGCHLIRAVRALRDASSHNSSDFVNISRGNPTSAILQADAGSANLALRITPSEFSSGPWLAPSHPTPNTLFSRQVYGMIGDLRDNQNRTGRQINRLGSDAFAGSFLD